jgi:stearoyl-CoA desaturase (delta-9 desaturase)
MKKSEINWGPACFLIIYQIVVIGILPFYFYYAFPSLALILTSIVLLYATGLSITAGYHRYYAHRSYKTNRFIEAILLFFASMAVQGSALRWAFDHRIHHAHVDTDQDPYSIKKGFWYAHFLWIIDKPRVIDPKVVPDLMKNRLVHFQDHHYAWCAILSNLFVFLLVGWLLNDFLGAFILASWTRLFVLHHFTWFINSLAHTWGDKPFCQEQSAVNNYILSFLTFGEGYHNYHHTFANDYRNGVLWYHFDPTKWLIWTLSKLGLAHHLKKMDPALIRKRMVLERKNLLSERLRNLWNDQCEDLMHQVNEISDRIVNQISHFSQLKERYHQLKQETTKGDCLKDMREEIKNLKKKLRQDWRQWVELSQNIMSLQPPKPLNS